MVNIKNVHVVTKIIDLTSLNVGFASNLTLSAFCDFIEIQFHISSQANWVKHNENSNMKCRIHEVNWDLLSRIYLTTNNVHVIHFQTIGKCPR